MNWQGRAVVCDAIRTTWAERSGSVKMYQLMGQDSFEEKSTQEALALKHVRDYMRRTLLVFPREGGRKVCLHAQCCAFTRVRTSRCRMS